MSCYLCSTNSRSSMLSGYYCEPCSKIQKIIDISSPEDVLETLEKVYLRKDKKLRDIKEKKLINELHNIVDEAHGLDPKTRAQKKKVQKEN
jgi:hypothetical protein